MPPTYPRLPARSDTTNSTPPRRSYFKADLAPFGDQAPDAPDAAAHLDYYTHQGEAFFTFNITGAVNMTVAKLVYGNPNIASEEGELGPPDSA